MKQTLILFDPQNLPSNISEYACINIIQPLDKFNELSK